MAFGRLPLKLVALIVFTFSFILFLSGWHIQQQSLHALEAALIKAQPPPPPPRKPQVRTEFEILDQANADRISALGRRKNVAYVQTLADKNEVCSTVMLFADLDRLGSVAERVLLYPQSWDTENTAGGGGGGGGTWRRLLKAAETRYGVVLKAVDPLLSPSSSSSSPPEISLLHVFAETSYSRILHLSSLGMVLRSLDDLLYNAPPTPLAATRAYWLPPDELAKMPLSDHFLLIEPSEEQLDRVKAALSASSSSSSSSPVELINKLFSSHALILPQHPYNTLTSEFAKEDHGDYIPANSWDAAKVREESFYIRFWDGTLGRPWYILSGEEVEKVAPKKRAERGIWNALYERWARVRMDVCGLDLDPLPDM